MPSRAITAASAGLAVVVSASVVSAAEPGAVRISAAPWSVGTVANDSLGHVRPTGLALGGMTILPSGKPVAAGLAETVAVNRDAGIRIEMAHGRNWDAYGELFSSSTAMRSSYLSGSSTFAAAQFALSRDVDVELSHTNLDLAAFDPTPPGTPTADLARRLGGGIQLIGTTAANLNWNFADWGGLALTASRSSGNGSLLGSVTPTGTAALAESATLGISARVGFGEGWITTVAYSGGVTQLDLNNAQLNARLDPVRSQAYGLGVAKQGLFGDDALGIAVSRPMQFYGAGNLASINPNLAQARESDLQLGYVTTFLDGTLALQANAAYQVNAAGARGQNAVTGVARAKLNF